MSKKFITFILLSVAGMSLASCTKPNNKPALEPTKPETGNQIEREEFLDAFHTTVSDMFNAPDGARFFLDVNEFSTYETYQYESDAVKKFASIDGQIDMTFNGLNSNDPSQLEGSLNLIDVNYNQASKLNDVENSRVGFSDADAGAYIKDGYGYLDFSDKGMIDFLKLYQGGNVTDSEDIFGEIGPKVKRQLPELSSIYYEIKAYVDEFYLYFYQVVEQLTTIEQQYNIDVFNYISYEGNGLSLELTNIHSLPEELEDMLGINTDIIDEYELSLYVNPIKGRLEINIYFESDGPNHWLKDVEGVSNYEGNTKSDIALIVDLKDTKVSYPSLDGYYELSA